MLTNEQAIANLLSNCHINGKAIYNENNERIGSFAHGCFRDCYVFYSVNFVAKIARNDAGEKQCEREYDIYKRACKAGVWRNFAKPRGDFYVNGMHVYMYDKIRDFANDSMTFNERDEYLNNETLRSFLASENITDFHAGNYGRRLSNGHYVLVDYTPEHTDGR